MSQPSPAGGASERARRSRAGDHPGAILAGVAMALSGALLLHWLNRLTFWRDEWDFLLHRRGWSPATFLHPFVEQLLAIPILIYRVLVTTFGMDSALPWQIVSVALFLLSTAVLFVYVSRRLGEWLALAAILPILFLGPSWDDLLFPFQMALFGSMACGIGAFLALDRRNRAGDLLAMVLLIVALLFFDLGIPFVAGAALEIGLGRDRWRRAFVVVVPTALWLLWYAAWGHNAHTFISVHNFANSASYVLNGLASDLATWVGLGVPLGDYQASPLDWGRPLLILAIGLAAWRAYVLRRPPARLLAALVVLLGFWGLTALNANPLAPPTAGRYQYLGICLMVLVAAELIRDMRIRGSSVAALVLIGAAAALANGVMLKNQAAGLAKIAQQERGGLAALELSRDRVDPGFRLTQQNSGVDYLGILDAGSYFSAIDAYGSPAFTPAELDGASEPARTSADMVFAAALGIRLVPTSAGGLRCHPAHTPTVVPREGLVLIAHSAGVQASLRRYATNSFPVSLGALPPGHPQLLRIPSDRSTRSWVLQLSQPEALTCLP